MLEQSNAATFDTSKRCQQKFFQLSVLCVNWFPDTEFKYKIKTQSVRSIQTINHLTKRSYQNIDQVFYHSPCSKFWLRFNCMVISFLFFFLSYRSNLPMLTFTYGLVLIILSFNFS